MESLYVPENIQTDKCAFYLINQCTNDSQNNTLLTKYNILPIQVYCYEYLLSLSRNAIFSFFEEYKSKYANMKFCDSCTTRYLREQYINYQYSINQYKCLYCKRCLDSYKFRINVSDIREFINYYENDINERLDELSNNNTHERAYLIANLRYIKNLRQILNRTNPRYIYEINNQTFNIRIGNMYPCNDCYILMCIIKKGTRKLKLFAHMPFYMDMYSPCNLYVNSLYEFLPSYTTRRILSNEINTIKSPKSLINICADKLDPEIIKHLLKIYSFSDKSRKQIYNTF